MKICKGCSYEYEELLDSGFCCIKCQATSLESKLSTMQSIIDRAGPYFEHDLNCEVRNFKINVCDCGLQALLSDIKELK